MIMITKMGGLAYCGKGPVHDPCLNEKGSVLACFLWLWGVEEALSEYIKAGKFLCDHVLLTRAWPFEDQCLRPIDN